MAIALKMDASGRLEQIQVGDSLQADSFERRNASGNLLVGSGLGMSEELRLGSTSALVRAMGDAEVDGMLELLDAAPILRLDETDAAANEKIWDIRSAAGDLFISTLTDAAGAGNDALAIRRTGTTVDQIDALSDLDLNSNDIVGIQTATFGAPVSQTTSTATLTINLSAGQKHRITLGSNITTVSITDPVGAGNFMLEFVQDGTGSRTVTGWPANVLWPGGTDPTFGDAAGSVRLVSLYYNGTTLDDYIGDYSSQVYS